MKTVLSVIGAFIALLVLVFVLNYYGYASFAFFAPKYAETQNKVFQQSQQYNEGMVRDLQNLKREYLAADPEGKAALRALTLHRFEVYPFEQLPPDLQEFYRSLQNEL